MPIFTRPIQASNVNYYGRLERGRQTLAVGMRISANEDTAMLLPIPVRPGAGAHEVRVIPFGERRALFTALEMGFAGAGSNRHRREDDDEANAPRTVRFSEAAAMRSCYIPNLGAFELVEEIFRLSDSVLAKNPQYASFGFMGFLLPAGSNYRLAPVGLDFPSRHDSALYFPTLTAAGDVALETVIMDATLYCQHAEKAGLDETKSMVGELIPGGSNGLLSDGHLVQRKVLYGSCANEDTLITL